ncbi:hypothetical protein GYMLUDRAFT_247949 [Collybiopsis luxurians FD-317 M1]|uniref:Unplaced genomic scaffold GYMLUscaffold_50, whole genome shotgun sequence n=1 Tax=Collybiopsis luxurians FD-317 M1 TaxID=944289 RepID=A0A0D0CEK4_9AGAR|nr:hypothetical protein GYMLUDRAFT_247949 [Collybiopsis luxurians FD-317 M1]
MTQDTTSAVSTEPLEPYEGFSPRVHGKLLPRFVGCYVTLPCEIIEDRRDSLLVLTCDQVHVQVSTTLVDGKPWTRFVEILGKYCNEGVEFLVATRMRNMGNDLDTQMMRSVIDIIHREPWATDIFNVHAQHNAAAIAALDQGSVEVEK